MIDTLFSVVQQYLNKATHAFQEDLFANRRSYRQVLRQTVTVAQDQERLLHQIQAVLWTSHLSDQHKIAELQHLLPAPVTAPQAPVDLEHVRQSYNLDGPDDFYQYTARENVTRRPIPGGGLGPCRGRYPF